MGNRIVDAALLHGRSSQTQIGGPVPGLLKQHFVEIDRRFRDVPGCHQCEAQRQTLINVVRPGERIAVSLNRFLITAALHQFLGGLVVTLGPVGAFDAEVIIKKPISRAIAISTVSTPANSFGDALVSATPAAAGWTNAVRLALRCEANRYANEEAFVTCTRRPWV